MSIDALKENLKQIKNQILCTPVKNVENQNIEIQKEIKGQGN